MVFVDDNGESDRYAASSGERERMVGSGIAGASTGASPEGSVADGGAAAAAGKGAGAAKTAGAQIATTISAARIGWSGRAREPAGRMGPPEGRCGDNPHAQRGHDAYERREFK